MAADLDWDATFGEVKTAEEWTALGDNDRGLADGSLLPLSNALKAKVATSEARTSSTYGDLTTPGPAVTADIGPNPMALVLLRAGKGGIASEGKMSFVVSGASTIAVSDSRCASAYYFNTVMFNAILLTAADGLTEGSNVFTAKYRGDNSNAATFFDRELTVIPFTATL